MPEILVSEGRTMAAPAAVANELIADYHTGHPSILPLENVGTATIHVISTEVKRPTAP